MKMKPLLKTIVCPAHLIDNGFVGNVVQKAIARYEHTVDAGVYIGELGNKNISVQRADINPIDNLVYCRVAISSNAVSSMVGRTVYTIVTSTRTEDMARVDIFLSPSYIDKISSSHIRGVWTMGDKVEATVREVQFINGRTHYALTPV